MRASESAGAPRPSTIAVWTRRTSDVVRLLSGEASNRLAMIEDAPSRCSPKCSPGPGWVRRACARSHYTSLMTFGTAWSREKRVTSQSLKLSAWCVLFLLIAAPCVSRAVDFKRLEDVAMREMRDTKTPGAAIAIVSGDRIVYVKGLGIAVNYSCDPAPECICARGSSLIGRDRRLAQLVEHHLHTVGVNGSGPLARLPSSGDSRRLR
jgi:hypothetical protein